MALLSVQVGSACILQGEFASEQQIINDNQLYSCHAISQSSSHLEKQY